MVLGAWEVPLGAQAAANSSSGAIRAVSHQSGLLIMCCDIFSVLSENKVLLSFR
jgi:hypothetical protein